MERSPTLNPSLPRIDTLFKKIFHNLTISSICRHIQRRLCFVFMVGIDTVDICSEVEKSIYSRPVKWSAEGPMEGEMLEWYVLYSFPDSL